MRPISQAAVKPISSAAAPPFRGAFGLAMKRRPSRDREAGACEAHQSSFAPVGETLAAAGQRR